MKPVGRRSAFALDLKVCLDGLRWAEEHEGLIDQVRAEVVPDAGARARTLPPAIADLGAIPTHLRPEFDDLTDRATGELVRDPEKVAVPTTILKYGEDPVHLRRGGGERASLGERDRERFVHHDMLAGAQGRIGERCVGVVGRGDDDEIDVRMSRCNQRIRDDLYGGVGGYGARGLTRSDHREREAGCRRDERRVEHATGVPEADERDPDIGHSGETLRHSRLRASTRDKPAPRAAGPSRSSRR